MNSESSNNKKFRRSAKYNVYVYKFLYLCTCIQNAAWILQDIKKISQRDVKSKIIWNKSTGWRGLTSSYQNTCKPWLYDGMSHRYNQAWWLRTIKTLNHKKPNGQHRPYASFLILISVGDFYTWDWFKMEKKVTCKEYAVLFVVFGCNWCLSIMGKVNKIYVHC